MILKKKNITEISAEIGIPKDLLRMWERRYGFPEPLRDKDGDRIYSNDEIKKLKLIKKLIDFGHRPGSLVTQSYSELEKKIDELLIDFKNHPHAEIMTLLLDEKAPQKVREFLKLTCRKKGLTKFILEDLSRINELIGFAWVAGEITPVEEHIYAEAAESVLREQMLQSTPQSQSPKILLTTLYGEKHRLGLLMAQAYFSGIGYEVYSLGAELSAAFIIEAIQRLKIDVLGLSISTHFKTTLAQQSVTEINKACKRTTILCGGQGAQSLDFSAKNIHIIKSFSEISQILEK